MTQSKLAREQVEELYELHAAGVRRFLLGVLRQGDMVDEALQQTFVQVLEKGHTADDETMKGWIYKVAFHEAMAQRRRQQTRGRMLGQAALDASLLNSVGRRCDTPPSDQLIEDEALRQAEAVVLGLPAAQREVLQMRFVESKTFAQIAEHLGVSLGTALTRMRLALTKLRRRLNR